MNPRSRRAASSDPVYWTAVEAANALRSKAISARELLQLTFDRIDALNPQINAIVLKFRQKALQRAGEADDALARRMSSGPLHGIPVTIKETFAYPESPSTWGNPEFGSTPCDTTAPAVELLERAGAIVIGKTNVPMMLTDWQSANPIYGRTNNPWDLSRTSGGSTGGGAAALAAGIGHLSLGSDIGGSIRIPAHFCGVYGHKPTFGLVSLAGHCPGSWDGGLESVSELPVAGPLARSAADLAYTLNVIGGPVGNEARAMTWRMPAPRRRHVREFRVGFVMDDTRVPVGSDLRDVYEAVIRAIQSAGATVTPGWPEGIDPEAQFDSYRFLLDSFLNATMRPSEEAVTHAGFYAARHQQLERRIAYRRAWDSYFQTHDVFLLPTAFTAAIPHDDTDRDHRSLGHTGRQINTPEGPRPYDDLLYWVSTASLTGLPATTAPVGLTTCGLPAGIQILGPMWEDATPIAFAGLLEKEIGGFVRPPTLA
jgi:amidase